MKLSLPQNFTLWQQERSRGESKQKSELMVGCEKYFRVYIYFPLPLTHRDHNCPGSERFRPTFAIFTHKFFQFHVMARKKAKISPYARPRRRTRVVTLEESRLSKHEFIKLKKHRKNARCLSELVVPTSPIPSAQPTARRKRPSRPLSGFKHPPKKARRIAVDLARACEKVFEDHGIRSDEADLHLIQSAIAKSKNGPSMLARLILPINEVRQFPCYSQPTDSPASQPLFGPNVAGVDPSSRTSI